MCGIAGLIDKTLDASTLRSRLIGMQEAIRHRGPDDEGLFVPAEFPIGLAHTRLSIQDLSSAGHQPMQTEDGQLTIVFNGEIYNFHQLRNELIGEGHVFHSTTDTEVILALYQRDRNKCVDRLEGMFAFAIWDKRDQSLFLARDPLGIKPLYYWDLNGRIAFASELRSLMKADLGPRRVCRNALSDFLMMGSIQEPSSLVSGISCLPAGHWMNIKDGYTTVRQYWSPKFGVGNSIQEDAVSLTRQSLDESIERHFVSDVPVGVFLSGGIDSTALVALARAGGRERLSTFCISFDEKEFNEGDLSYRTAQHFKTDHHDWRMKPEDGQSLIGGFLDALDQPSNDGFNTYCVSKFARDSGLKVVLSGVGGDEVFGGYPSFRRVPQLIAWHKRLGGTRGLANWALQKASRFVSPQRSLQMARLSAYLASDGTAPSAYGAVRSFYTLAEARKLIEHYTGICYQPTTIASQISQPTCEDIISELELTRYMKNQLLRDSDVMSMAHGLELRTPFVDSRFIDSVSPIAAAIRLELGKRLLLKAVPEIPQWIAEQPKRGFRFPFQQWVDREWKSVFDRIDRESPVNAVTWYRRWLLFTLEHFVQRNDVSFT